MKHDQKNEGGSRGTPAAEIRHKQQHQHRMFYSTILRLVVGPMTLGNAPLLPSSISIDTSAGDSAATSDAGLCTCCCPRPLAADDADFMSNIFLGFGSRSIRVSLQPSGSAKAITIQEGIDGYHEKAMRVASVELVELGSIVELSVSGHVLR